ncbi:MAG: rhodanese-like domain-containing protein [Alphaproteobacteria bacterium]|jgi:rhodanese-related sulfurtransferase|nr:rhodanese-like domain-containing protein [Alphaproteobacteria bacterium]MBP9777213.1 rhodanese-like domain-containing protein [Alphaproteobacteria bacterium]
MQSHEITIEDVQLHREKYILVDVREPHELIGPEGHIEGAILATLGWALTHFLEFANPDKEYVFICRSGVRSGKACELAYNHGFTKSYNMKGGMLAWNEKQGKF